MNRDSLIHGRRTIMGFDLAFGRKTTAPCGKVRETERTSADLRVVTCLPCRAWAAEQEREMAGFAEAAAEIAREHPEYVTDGATKTPEYFLSLAARHRATAAQWDKSPQEVTS